MADDDRAWLITWRDAVVQAFTQENKVSLARLALSAIKRNPTADALGETGAGRLLQDSNIWQSAGVDAEHNAISALTKWKKSAASTKGPNTVSATHPLGPLKAKGFSEALIHFKRWMLLVDSSYAEKTTCDNVAFLFSIRGFTNWRQIVGLTKCDVESWTACASSLALLTRAKFC